MRASSFAVYTILSRKLAGEVSEDITQFYSGAVDSILTHPFIFFIRTKPLNIVDWFILLLHGAFELLEYQLLTLAHTFLEANLLPPH